MGWETDKLEYIGKLQRVDAGIQEIAKLSGNQIVTPAMEQELQTLRAQAEELLRKLQQDEFEIAVVGLESAGKSFFANALTDLNALPTADERCTYTSTCIRPGPENMADVVFYSAAEFTRDLQEKLKQLGIEDSDHYNLSNLTLEKYEQLYAGCTEDAKARYGTTLNQDIMDTLQNKGSLQRYIGQSPAHFTAEQLQTSDFTGFITDPGKAIAAKDVTIYSTELGRMLGSTEALNAVLYDVPGFNSPTAMHEEQTLQKMDRADVIIMVAKAHEPSLDNAVLNIFDRPDADGNLMKEKLFVFANKADWATDLEKNKAKTRSEWIETRRILPAEHADRIVFGSAKAHLGDETARESLRRKGATDGITEMREKLVRYYTTDRFSVLRRRIDRILFDVDQLFKDAKERFGTGGPARSDPSRTEYNSLLLKRTGELRRQVHEALVQLKDHVNRDARDNRPLTGQVVACIDSAIRPEKYGLDDALIDKIHIERAGIGAAEQPLKIDGEVRERRFDEMYGEFTSGILESTRSKHQEVCDRVVDIFMDAVHADPHYTDIDALRNEVVAFCRLDEQAQNEDDVYYQSLIERFARDVFEVQIKFVPGIDRLRKFQEEAPNFFSLGVFYNASQQGDAADGYVSRAPADSALWRLLLYPDYAAVLTDDTALEKLREVTGQQEIDDRAQDLLRRLVNVYGPQVSDRLEEAFRGVTVSRQPAAAAPVIAGVLGELLEDVDESPRNILDGTRYMNDIASRQQHYTYKDVQQEFDDDLHALSLVLRNAFVPAVHVDKAFSARESKLIEDIVSRLDSDAFLDFVSANFSRIAAAALRDYEAAEAQRTMNTAVMREIQRILDAISAGGSADVSG